MQNLDTKLFASNLYWPDRHWSFVMVPDAQHGFDFVNDNAVEIDKRAAAWFFFTFYPKVLTDRPGTVYRNHFYIEKLLGNLIGLGRLMTFVAAETGTKVGALTVISTHAEIDTMKSSRQEIVKLIDASTPTVGFMNPAA
jgi:hypothetical protein